MRRQVLVALGVLAAVPAMAADVSFSGTLSGICTLALPTPGILAMNAAGDLTSEAGVPAVVTILSIGSNTVTVSPPDWVSTPGTYDDTGESLEVAYFGVGGLGLVEQAFTDAESDFNISTLPLTALTMNARAINPNGFEAGSYSMKVTVTCAP